MFNKVSCIYKLILLTKGIFYDKTCDILSEDLNHISVLEHDVMAYSECFTLVLLFLKELSANVLIGENTPKNLYRL